MAQKGRSSMPSTTPSRPTLPWQTCSEGPLALELLPQAVVEDIMLFSRRDFLRTSGALTLGSTLGAVGLPVILGSSPLAAAQDGPQTLRTLADRVGFHIGVSVGG